MPDTYVVHLGNSKDFMEIAEDSVAKRVLREHVRESLGVQDEDLLFAMINSMHFAMLIYFLVFSRYAYCASFIKILSISRVNVLVWYSCS